MTSTAAHAQAPRPGDPGIVEALVRAQNVVSDFAANLMLNRRGELGAAMFHALSGGKAFRAFLALESARLHGFEGEVGERCAFAIECIHAYSLIHDDLPCMDDDDLRRGRPTVHRKWDEATAVLAGDALQALAFDVLTVERMDPRAAMSLVHGLARAAGIGGMVGGQAMDIAAETATSALTLDDITRLQGQKTGALISWAASVGPRLSDTAGTALAAYSHALGLVFQITDDILDATGDAATVGKATGKDAGAGKATFVSLLGLDGARARAAELAEEAHDALVPYGGDAETLRAAARFVLDRDR